MKTEPKQREPSSPDDFANLAKAIMTIGREPKNKQAAQIALSAIHSNDIRKVHSALGKVLDLINQEQSQHPAIILLAQKLRNLAYPDETWTFHRAKGQLEHMIKE